MTRTEGGRYCGQCAKVVTDFTKMTDAQLIDWMRTHHGGCGNFRSDQLNRDLIHPVVRKAPAGFGWLMSLLILTGCVRDQGADKHKAPAAQQHTLGEPLTPNQQPDSQNLPQRQLPAAPPPDSNSEVLGRMAMPAGKDPGLSTPSQRFPEPEMVGEIAILEDSSQAMRGATIKISGLSQDTGGQLINQNRQSFWQRIGLLR